MLDFEESLLQVDLYTYHFDLGVIIINTSKNYFQLPVRVITFCHLVETDPALLLLVELF